MYWWKYIGIWLLLCFEWSKIPIVIMKVAQLGYYTFLPLTEKRSFSWQRAELFFFENSKFIRMPDQIHKVILRFLSDLGDLKMRRMFVVYSSFLCWGIKPTSAQMAVMISPITIQSNNENCTETNTYYDRYFEIKYSTIKQRKIWTSFWNNQDIPL